MEIPLTPEHAQQFHHLAASEGRKVDELMHEALTRYLDEETKFIEAVRRGEAQLDRGETVSHEAVGARLAQLFGA